MSVRIVAGATNSRCGAREGNDVRPLPGSGGSSIYRTRRDPEKTPTVLLIRDKLIIFMHFIEFGNRANAEPI